MTKHEKYLAKYNETVLKAREMGLDYGLEWNEYSKDFRSFMLPKPENRYGHELRCEVVRPTDPLVGRMATPD